ncbi:winged helix-turn-helix domain-containing protein [Shewanella sp. KX20019]|uniref:winged helix-turn-helix domain-containing protein n=1 Tax=Shewanella sp. KX20019 TaxID=2803864 RepID=UPI0019285E5B|nr:winged helix-turn-helix domain-containing protein [Shewanella sp. KX20019]QQX79340.1 winged helix-turn-helix domain-containing protein [Shewanella sp. KX20019]
MSLNQTVSKQQKAFYRKLFIAHQIETEAHNLLSLHKLTNMPRRTLQDSIAAFSDLGIVCEFVQDGARNNAGYYKISDWGPIKSDWVKQNLAEIEALLND